MTDRDKIAEIIRNARMFADPLSQVGYAEADALLANGMILPPCKVGQTVYIIDEADFEDYAYVLDVKISSVGRDVGGVWVTMDLPLGFERSAYIGAFEIGRTVFLTKGEAERALAERKENNDQNT